MLTVLLEYGDCSIRVYRSFSLTCNLTSENFQYTKNNYIYYASIMLDAFRYLLCRHNRPGPNSIHIYIVNLKESASEIIFAINVKRIRYGQNIYKYCAILQKFGPHTQNPLNGIKSS